MRLLDDRVGDDEVLPERRATDHLEEEGHPAGALLSLQQPRGLRSQVLAVGRHDLLGQGFVAGAVLDRQLVLATLQGAVSYDDVAVLVEPADAGAHVELPQQPRLVEGRGGIHQLLQPLLHLPGGQFAVKGLNLEFGRGRGGRRFHRTSASFINVKRKTFNQSFTSGVEITGATSGATANVVSVTQIEESSLMGNNAVVNSFAGIVNGSITSLSVIDSGFAYEDGESINIEIDTNAYIATGYANLINQGVGEGYFKSTKGFLNSDKYIHDGDFYQFYSYQIQTELPLETYGDTLKKLMHVAGTKLFGNVIKVSNVDVTIKSSGVEITT